jgi:DNA-binding response OmpR family regulator
MGIFGGTVVQYFQSMNTKRILVVDDDSIIRSVLVEILGMHQYDTLECDTARCALRVAMQEMPDVVVLDVHMPDSDGLMFLQQLRAHETTRTIPVIILTADVSESMLYRGFEHGTNDFLTKPFRSRELLLRIEALIRARDNMLHAFSTRLKPQPYLSQDEQFISDLNTVIESVLKAGISGDVTTQFAARRLGISPATLQRRIRRLFGTSFGQWLLETRLDRARGMLVRGATPMSRIAQATGFTNPSYFSYVFKRRYGIPPRLYREQYRSANRSLEG